MRIGLFCLLLILIAACKYEDHAKENNLYFDLEFYFKQEAARLAKKNEAINKTVIINNKVEHKKILITNWKQELSSFIDADINKASWRGSFSVTKTDSLETYLSDNEKISVKKIEVLKLKDKLTGIKIFIANKNVLYTSNDTLTYYPDSLYEIKKSQKIKLMNGKQYIVRGMFH